MTIEQYEPRGPEVTASDGRYSVIYLPDENPAIDAIFMFERDPDTFFGRVDAILGEKKVRVDFLGRAPDVGPLIYQSMNWKPKFEVGSRASECQWSIYGTPWHQQESEVSARTIVPLQKRLDACAPFVEHGVNVAFLEQRMTPTFFSPPKTCSDQSGVGFHDDAPCAWDVFSRSLGGADDAIIYTTLGQTFEQDLKRFVHRGSTLLFVVEVAPDLFPIVESFSVADADTVWVVGDLGRVNLIRSSSKFESETSGTLREEMARAEKAFEFALMTGDSVENVVTPWSQPVFDFMEV